MTQITLLDCTLRDGGYYNAWDFSPDLVADYLAAMCAAGVDIVELGQRFVANTGFKGPHAYTTDAYLRSLPIPAGLKVAVMVNGSDLLGEVALEATLGKLFPARATDSPVDVVRVACHVHEMERALPAAIWLKDRGYIVGFNLMQVADRSHEEVVAVATEAAGYPIDALYFADSMGSMSPDHCAKIISWLREGWPGPIGIHTHDNMGLALQNTLRAEAEGVTWLDATVTGMGRGPGNARTEELVIALDGKDGRQANMVPLLTLIRKYLQPMKNEFGWGTNPYYFLSGKYGIHPTYVQEMLGNPQYSEEDVIAVLDHLRQNGGKKYNAASLNAARFFYQGEAGGSWAPGEVLAGREVLLLGTGPGARRHRAAIEAYIDREKPVVLALNTQSAIGNDLIDLRVACHPVRLLADASEHGRLPQPLVTPASELPESLRASLNGKELLDFGIAIEPGTFAFGETGCTVPAALVICYALAVVASGRAARVLLAGFDGFPAGDARNTEMEEVLKLFQDQSGVPPLVAITPSAYPLPAQSVYGL